MAEILDYNEETWGIVVPDCKNCWKPHGEPENDDELLKFCKCWRPTKYKEEYAEQILAWFQTKRERIFNEYWYHKPSDEHVKTHYAHLEKKLQPDDEVHVQWGLRSVWPKIIRDLFPTFQRRASDLEYEYDGKTYKGVHSTVLKVRARKHPSFFYAITMCKEIQEALLWECGLNGTYIHKMVELALATWFNIVPKSQVDMTTNWQSLNSTIPTNDDLKVMTANKGNDSDVAS